VRGAHDILQTEIFIAKLFVTFQIEIEKLNRYKSPGTYQIARELINSRNETRFLVPKLTNNICSTEDMSILHHFIKRVTKLTVVTFELYHCY
jgi:hypothetical protein